jgi:hypothetical protein
VKIEYDPIAKYLVQKSKLQPSFQEYETTHEETTTFKDTRIVKHSEEELQRLLKEKKKLLRMKNK